MTALALVVDPLRRTFDALEAAGCAPKGDLWKFRAKCPAHRGENANALSVAEGVDGRVVLHCFRGCEPVDVIGALGLGWGDLFPIGHRHGPKLAPTRTKRSRTEAAAMLDSLAVAGFMWSGLVQTVCPYCGAPGTRLAINRKGAVDVDCPDGCTREQMIRALECRVAIAEAGLKL
jgi:hypothetical protein